ncbi:MAG: esterase-like activity of phytase family protein [Burkholderiaceae bacterium]
MKPAFPHFAAGICLLLSSLSPARAQMVFPAELAGHAWLPARSFVDAPKDAPAFLRSSGKFTAPDGRRVEQLESIMGTSYISDKAAPRETGVRLPFKSQAVQGFSGIKRMADGTFWVLTDNGFGSRNNSADAMLMFHQVRPDWKRGAVTRLQTRFLHDPDRKIPFLIVNEATDKRYLTGADLDIESMQIVGQELWFGDELGPYLIRTDLQGKVLALYETQADGRTLKSPDHYTVGTPGAPGSFGGGVSVRRSRGFEGMALSKDGRFLYPLLEGALWSERDKQLETKDGREYLRVLEFDIAKGAWTGRSWKYLLEANGNSIGDFNMIDADTGLIIERDQGEGLVEEACNGPAHADCQNTPARLKRIYKVSLTEADAEGFVRKIGYIDLLDIADPQGVARRGARNGRFAFPFVTIENVDVVDAEHIVVANDNNLPYSSGRQNGVQDDNEFILLKVPELLKAR